MNFPTDGAGVDAALARLDSLIDQTADAEKLRAGLGMRLALSMAREMRAGKPLGSGTADLVAEWAERFGSETVDAAVAIARAFLTQPSELAKEFAARLGMEPPPA